ALAEAVHHALRLAQRQGGDAVVTLHPAEGRVVAHFAEGVDGKVVILYLGLLKTEHVGAIPPQPVEDQGKAAADGVNVPGGDLHASIRLPIIGAIAPRSSEIPAWPRRLRSSALRTARSRCNCAPRPCGPAAGPT